MRWLVLALCGCEAVVPLVENDAAVLDFAMAPDQAQAAASDLATVDGAPDMAKPECAYGGAPGTCISTTMCAAIGNHTSEPGLCPGPANIQCCIQTPSLMNNPPTPTGYTPMMDGEVTPDMTAWAVMILHDPVTYPMFSTTTKVFGTLTVLALVEWHPPDFQNSVIHRGVTLFKPL